MVQSDIGMSVNVERGLETLETADIVIVPYWHHPTERPSQALLDALIAAHRRGAQVVGLCLGTYVLAYAGLLDNRRAATHWELERDFTERFPAVQLDTNALYIDDERLITSAGTAAGIDCCLYLVRKQYGSAAANRVARRMVVAPYREGGGRSLLNIRCRKIRVTVKSTRCWITCGIIFTSRIISTRWRVWSI